MGEGDYRPMQPVVMFRRHVDGKREGALCRVRVELPEGVWAAGPHRLVDAEVDLADAGAGDGLAAAVAEAFAQVTPAGDPWPGCDVAEVVSAFARKRADFFGDMVRVEIDRPTCDGRSVYGDLRLLARWPRERALLSERLRLTDPVAVEDAIERARGVWREQAGPGRGDLIDWGLVAERIESRRSILLERYRDQGLLQGMVSTGTVMTVRLADVAAEAVHWLWPLWVPRSHLTLVAGDPGVGKSWFVLALATAVSLGAPLPGMGQPVERGNVLLFALEDGTATVVRPRMELMGADLSRVHVYTHVDAGGQPRALVLPEDTPLLQAAIHATAADLVVIDPLVSLQNPALDANRQVTMRSILGPLMAAAEAEGSAVLFCHHLNKATGQDPLYRINASVDLVAASRVGIAVGRDREDSAGIRRGVAVFKSNLGEVPKPTGFTIDKGRFGWLADGTSHLTADRLFSPPDEAGIRQRHDRAEEFLREVLAEGPVRQRAIREQAHQAEIDDHSLRKARERMKVVVEQIRDQESNRVLGWQWRLPGEQGAATTPPAGSPT